MTIRPLTSTPDCRRAAALERQIWDYDAAAEADVVSPALMVASVKRGAILLGAFDDAGQMQGFVFSIPGLKAGVPMQWSHMLGVVKGAREAGVGGRLKLAQREAALGMGIDLIEWTYDPLQAGNAHLNFAKLGVVVEVYEQNVYGDSGSALHRGTPTDRFVAEWHLTRPHVERRIASWGHPVVRDQSVSSAVLVNPSAVDGEWRSPGRADFSSDGRRLLVEIPAGFSGMQAARPDLALAWRLHTRQVFESYLSRGYRVVDFLLARDAGRGHYLLARPD